MLGSTFEMCYGTLALFNGVLVDRCSPRIFLIGSLFMIAFVNMGIASTSSLPVMVFLWGCNGCLQSFGWPAITTVFLAWFPDPASRGSWYSLLSTCQNAGAALVPLGVSLAMAQFGWRAALFSPAMVCCCVASLLACSLYGSPTALREQEQGVSPKQLPQAGGLGRMLGEQVMQNPALWLMGLNYFGVSMVRTCLSDWTSVFLLEAKGIPLTVSARCLFFMEVGGFAGSLVAGAVSDRLYQGRRGPVVCICTFLLVPTLLLLTVLKSTFSIQLAYCALGCCAFPVHVLLGLFSREVVPPGVSSSAGGFVKCIAQVGGACAGYPLGLLQQNYGWNGVFTALALVSGLAAGVAAPLWNQTAQLRITSRNGTVADFQAMQKGMKHKSS